MKQLEQEIWDEVRRGSRTAFERLYEYFSRDLFRYGYRICQDKGLVQDAVQELFLQLWKKRLQLIQVESPRFYLYRSLRNRLIRYNESNRFVFVSHGHIQDTWFGEQEDAESGWIEKYESETRVEQLHAALDRLSVRQREAIQLRYYHDFTTEEIARIMEMNEQSVRNLLYRALRCLRTEFPFLALSGLFWLL